ncbi:17704_t:CDS:2 [Rhizophagus irregularis]|nr:17704_t:CDS:2 [Rhizophagus irregularis]
MFIVPHVNLPAIFVGAAIEHVAAALIYGPLLGNKWTKAMNEDKHTDKWFPRNVETMKSVHRRVHFINIASLLLNLTNVQTNTQAFQLGMILFLGWVIPDLGTQHIWESWPSTLGYIKALRMFINTVSVSIAMFNWGTR